ncbi:hypothetical protein Kuura_014 [Caulobacter phage Kuura]|nr:hypothetical protein Kuura_014 [Caulobacter phage Kuura]
MIDIYSSDAPIIGLPFSAEAIGGVAPYSYSWTGGDTPNEAYTQLTVERGTLGTSQIFQLTITVTDADADIAVSVAYGYRVFWV